VSRAVREVPSEPAQAESSLSWASRPVLNLDPLLLTVVSTLVAVMAVVVVSMLDVS
jgi:hypothetical protein